MTCYHEDATQEQKEDGWEIGFCAIDVTKIQAYKVSDALSSKTEIRKWLHEQVDNGNIDIMEIYNPNTDNYI